MLSREGFGLSQTKFLFMYSWPFVKACIAMKKTPRVGVRIGKNASFRYLVDLAFQNPRKEEVLNGAFDERLVDELSCTLHALGFLEDYWGAPGGDPKDMFLGLAIQRGFIIYISQHLRYCTPKTIASKRPNLGGKTQSLLSCALSVSEIFTGEAKLSNVMLLVLKKGSDPNERVSGRTFLFRYLEFLAGDGTYTVASLEMEYSRILKALLTHGADPNETEVSPDGKTEQPVWMIFAMKFLQQDIPETMFDFYLELVELCLLFRADPNLGQV
ncbi:hypothetical protein P171DRAFT_130679 [Karstenula rhodostoma CBS 690.94]|uniref:Uncharacterized protein n=1 Tax=Karstenula rhodostoma CBS 690.94 TaxID=1392251 RepID=A0A9P4P628_9PLEO|nr:hypothetical protein P171DRAFT_130679 [Karstenula rhodostoma CBS 690.94]